MSPPTQRSLAATFARQLRSARRARNLTQAEVAERVGIAVEVFGRLERGRALPRADTLARLASALGVSTDSLLGLAPVPLPPAAVAGEALGDYAGRPEMRRLLRRLGKEPARAVSLLAAFVSAMQDSTPRKRD